MIEITITETAKDKLLEVIRHFGAQSIRLIRQGFGWTGPRLAMVLDEPREEDEIVLLQGIEFVYNKHEEDLFDQTVIDYKDSWYGEGFTVCSPASEPCWSRYYFVNIRNNQDTRLLMTQSWMPAKEEHGV